MARNRVASSRHAGGKLFQAGGRDSCNKIVLLYWCTQRRHKSTKSVLVIQSRVQQAQDVQEVPMRDKKVIL